MPNKIKPRRSYTANAVPTTSDLDANELAINWADGKAYTKNAAGNIVSVTLGGGGGGSGSIVTAASVSAFPASGSASNLYITTEDQRIWRWDATASIYVESGPIGGGFAFASVPATPTATGSAGQLAFDANYQYTCVQPNYWKRAALSAWLPVSTGLQLWLDASDAGSLYDATTGGSLVAAGAAVARWEDKSGNGRHVSDASNQPTRQTAVRNGLDVIRFDGTNDILRTTGNFPLTGNAASSVFVVYRKTSNTKGSVFGWGDAGTLLGAWGYYEDGTVAALALGGGNQFNTTTLANNTWAQMSVLKTAGAINATTTTRRNGSSIAASGHSSTTPNITAQPFTVGRWSNYDLDGSSSTAFQGDIGEIIIYNAALSDTDRAAVESYLMTKWGIT
jgi:hypothetical protein